jgi:hypothetical protein
MNDESDHDVFNCAVQKGKRISRIEDSGSSSDSPFEQCKKRRRVPVSDILKLCAMLQFRVVLFSHLQYKNVSTEM